MDLTAYTAVTYDLTVDVDPSGSGDIKVNGVAPASYPHTYTFPEDASVSLEAIPASGYNFDHWSGSLTGSSNPTSITMNGNKSIVAHFVEAPPPPPPTGVGGEAFPPNKLAILGPIIALSLAIIAVVTIGVRRRRVQS